MIILVGESGSGKSTIEKILSDKYGYEKTVSYTTRPARKEEKDGVDYHFISEDEYIEKFNDGFFAETGAYNNWLYGTTKDQYHANTVCVLTPHGLRQIKRTFYNNGEMEMKSFYIKVPRRDRLVKILQRGDDMEEAIRRNQSDVGQYDGIEDEVDFVVENSNYTMNPFELAFTINELYKGGDN